MVLAGMRFDEQCMASLLNLLRRHPQIMSLNMGEKGEVSEQAWDMFIEAIECFEVGVVFTFADTTNLVPSQIRRLKDACMANQRERERRARVLLEGRGCRSVAWRNNSARRLAPWRDHGIVEDMRKKCIHGSSMEAAFGKVWNFPGRGLAPQGKKFKWWWL